MTLFAVVRAWSEVAGVAERLAPGLFDVALKSVGLCAVAGIAALSLRRASAAARHWVWLLAMTGLLLLPVLSAALPPWNVVPRAVAWRVDMRVHDTGVMVAELPELAPAAAPAGAAVAPVPVAAPQAEVMPVNATGNGGPVAAAAPIAVVAKRVWPFSLAATLVILWLAGAAVLLGQVLLGYLSLAALQRRCVPFAGEDWAELLMRLRGQLGVRRRVMLLSSTRRTMPMTWGLWRSRLLLPADAATWTAERRAAVLLHELGHVKRGDCLAQLLAQLACAVYWFNPLVWVAWRRMQVERERACDDLVLNSGARASAYAEHLLHSASVPPAIRFATAAVAMARPSTLEERLRAILDPKRNRRALSLGAAIVTFVFLMAALIPVAALRAQENPALAAAAADGVPLPPGYSPARAAAVAEAPAPPATATAPARPTGRSGRGFGGPAGAAAPATVGEGPTCTLDATIYDLRLPTEKIGQLDVDALTKAAANGPAAFEKALAELGIAQPLYRASQSVRLASDSITISTNTPYVTNSQPNRQGGGNINSVAYTQTGAVFSLAGKTEPAGIELDMKIELSSMSEGTTAIGNDVKAPLMRRAAMTHSGPVVPRQPFVVLTIDAASTDSAGRAVAYIARVTLGQPQGGRGE